MTPSSRALTLLDYASLVAGLELLPHRAAGVFAYFGLDEGTGRREMARWEAALASRPNDRDELAKMRARMVPHWVRWDRETPLMQASVPAKAGPAAAQAPAAAHETTKLSLLEYGSLLMGLELQPTRTAQVFDSFGLRTVRERDIELTAWEARLAARPEELAIVEAEKQKMRTYWQRWAERPREPSAGGAPPTAPSSAATAAPERRRSATKYVPRKRYQKPRRFCSPRELEAREAAEKEAEKTPSQRPPPSTTLPLLDYAALSFRLEGAPANLVSRIFADYGLEQESGEREVVAWKHRLAVDPALRAEYEALCARMAASREREELPPSSVRVQDVEITIQQYAELCVEWEHDPRSADELFRNLGLLTASARASVDATWRLRLASSPEDCAAFERLRAELRAKKQAQRGAVATPLVGSRVEPAPIELLEYACLCVELDLEAGKPSAVAERLQLDAAGIDRAHRYWQARFAQDQEARTTWVAHTNRLRRHWRLPTGRA